MAGILPDAVLITTLSLDVGTVPVLQLVFVFQSVLVVPVQVNDGAGQVALMVILPVDEVLLNNPHKI